MRIVVVGCLRLLPRGGLLVRLLLCGQDLLVLRLLFCRRLLLLGQLLALAGVGLCLLRSHLLAPCFLGLGLLLLLEGGEAGLGLLVRLYGGLL